MSYWCHELGREKPIEVRFIEYMPFGGNKWNQGKMFSYQEMLIFSLIPAPTLFISRMRSTLFITASNPLRLVMIRGAGPRETD
jgi:hypothetical protein